MNSDYDESRELYRYVSSHHRNLLTPLERRAQGLLMLRAKALHSQHALTRDRLLSEYKAKMDEQVSQLIGDDLDDLSAFRERIIVRIRDAITNGHLEVNRCPSCKRV